MLKGDLEPAIETHKMYWQLFEKYGFFPEAYTLDLKIHWGNWPLRPVTIPLSSTSSTS